MLSAAKNPHPLPNRVQYQERQNVMPKEKAKKQEKKPETPEEFVARVSKDSRKRNGNRRAFGWKR